MRVISPPVSAAPLQPVGAPHAAGNRTHRDQAPATAAPASKSTVSARTFAATTAKPSQGWDSQGTVEAGVTAQKVFHAVYGGLPEASLTEANRAYTKSDELRFRDTPFSQRVI